MGIIVCDKNKEKIEALLDKVQDKCTVRLVSYNTVGMACKEIERQLGVSKTAMNGVRYRAEPYAQKFAGAYKYVPYNTVLWVSYHNGHWTLDKAERTSVYSRYAKYELCEMTDALKEGLLAKFRLF